MLRRVILSDLMASEAGNSSFPRDSDGVCGQHDLETMSNRSDDQAWTAEITDLCEVSRLTLV